MRLRWEMFLAVASFAAPSRYAMNAADDDRAKFAGVWQGFVVEGRGDRPDRGPVKLEITVTGDKMSSRDLNARDTSKADLGEGTYKLDGAQNPKTIDATGTNGQNRGKLFPGIYLVDGNTLKWCVANPGKQRPTEFISRPSGGQFLMVLKRVKKS